MIIKLLYAAGLFKICETIGVENTKKAFIMLWSINFCIYEERHRKLIKEEAEFKNKSYMNTFLDKYDIIGLIMVSLISVPATIVSVPILFEDYLRQKYK